MQDIPIKKSAFSRNLVFSSISELSIILLFVLTILSARILGDAQFGVFSFALAFVSMFAFLIDGGFRWVYARNVARDESLAEYYLGNALTLQIISSILGFICIVTIVNLLDKSPDTILAVYILGVTEILRFFKYLYRYVFRVADHFDLETVTVIIERVSLLVFGVYMIANGHGVIGLSLAFLITRLFDLIITFAISQRVIVKSRLRFDFGVWKEIVKQAIPFVLSHATLLMLYKLDSVLLSVMTTDAEVGWYGASYRILEGLILFPLILSGTLYPALSRAHNDKPELVKLYTKGIRYAFLLAMPLTLIGVTLSADGILFIYGAEYENSIPALRILLLGLPFMFIQEIGAVMLAAIERQRVALIISVTALIVNIILNLLLIPEIGYLGAAIATIVSQVIFGGLIVVYLFIRKYHINYLRLSLKPLTAAALVTVLLYFSEPFLVFAAIIAVAGYFLLLTLFAFWNPGEIAAARNIITQGLGLLGQWINRVRFPGRP
jgi:O-antigen/teichoic acid export membrane protein